MTPTGRYLCFGTSWRKLRKAKISRYDDIAIYLSIYLPILYSVIICRRAHISPIRFAPFSSDGEHGSERGSMVCVWWLVGCDNSGKWSLVAGGGGGVMVALIVYGLTDSPRSHTSPSLHDSTLFYSHMIAIGRTISRTHSKRSKIWNAASDFPPSWVPPLPSLPPSPFFFLFFFELVLLFLPPCTSCTLV